MLYKNRNLLYKKSLILRVYFTNRGFPTALYMVYTLIILNTPIYLYKIFIFNSLYKEIEMFKRYNLLKI